MKKQKFWLHRAVANNDSLPALIAENRPCTGDFTILYQGECQLVSAYKGGAIICSGNLIQSTDGEIIADEEHDGWDVFYNNIEPSIIIQVDRDFFRLTKGGKELVYSSTREVTFWGLNNKGLILYNQESKTLFSFDLRTQEETLLFSSEKDFKWEAGWEGVIIDTYSEIFYCCSNYTGHLADKESDKYSDWLINQSSPCPAIILTTEESLIYVRQENKDEERHYALTNEYEDFWPCKEGILLYYENSWRYLSYLGEETLLSCFEPKEIEVISHSYGALLHDGNTVKLLFL